MNLFASPDRAPALMISLASWKFTEPGGQASTFWRKRNGGEWAETADDSLRCFYMKIEMKTGMLPTRANDGLCPE